MGGEVLAADGAFLDLGLGAGDRLSHLGGHEPGEGIPAAPQRGGDRGQQRGARFDRTVAPQPAGGRGAYDPPLDFVGRVLRVVPDGLAGGGVDRLHRILPWNGSSADGNAPGRLR